MASFRGTKKSSSVRLTVNGLILSESYQKCKTYVEQLWKYQGNSFLMPSVKGYLEVDWLEYLNGLRKSLGGQTWAVKKSVVVFVDGVFIGGEEELFSRFSYFYMFKTPTADKIRADAKKEYLEYLNKDNLLYVYFEIAVSGEFIGTMLFQLRADMLPKTCTWFALHCDPSNPIEDSYKGSNIHRICKRGWFQAGRTDCSDPWLMDDESFCYKHDRRGILSFANEGKGTNYTEFFVTFKPSSWMDQYYVAFGRLVEGSSVLSRIENIECTYESPDDPVTIEKCGLAKVGMGKRMPVTARMKGLTVGVPHIQPDTFMDLVFDRFCEVLFDRLDAEVKLKFHQEWIGEMLWEKVHELMCAKGPPEDVLDLKDRPSMEYSQDLYLAGLYGHRDIPDHYITKMLHQLVEEAVERSGVVKMAQSVVDFILDLVKSESEAVTEVMAENVVEYLIDNVYRIIFGEEGTSQEGIISRSLSQILMGAKDDTTSTPDNFQEMLPEGRLSTKTLVVKYIWQSLMKVLDTD
uniref:PPIase cyclophilin-type domain-containing protein n=1 Tax=Graphocephala atropunctata TaxID=36148 RepID=A0A1B6KLE3_9HEMI